MKFTVLDYLETTADRYPDKIAFADTKSSITWRELVIKAKSISNILKKYFDIASPYGGGGLLFQ